MDEHISMKIRSMISKLDAIIARLERNYNYIYSKAITEKDLEKRQMYMNELEEIRKYARKLMTIQLALEFMHGRDNLDVSVIRQLKRMAREVMPELYFELDELEPSAKESNSDILRDAIILTEQRMKTFGEW